MTGLGERWRRVYPAYHKIADVYERMNMAMTWGNVDRWRRQAAALLDGGAARVLDAGCGPGNMAKHIKAGRYVVGLDYSQEMLKDVPYDDVDRVQGVFERLPFRDDAFDAAVAGYSLHAAQDLERAIVELSRAAREVVAVSMGKPDNGLVELLFRMYVFYVIPLMAKALAPGRAEEYKALKEILSAAPRNKALKALLGRYLDLRYFGARALGAVYIFAGVRRATRLYKTA